MCSSSLASGLKLTMQVGHICWSCCAYAKPMLGQEPHVHLSLETDAQMSTMFLGQVGWTMLGSWDQVYQIHLPVFGSCRGMLGLCGTYMLGLCWSMLGSWDQVY